MVYSLIDSTLCVACFLLFLCITKIEGERVFFLFSLGGIPKLDAPRTAFFLVAFFYKREAMNFIVMVRPEQISVIHLGLHTEPVVIFEGELVLRSYQEARP
jgi:hypothetical protein